jgi:hypothetical protein
MNAETMPSVLDEPDASYCSTIALSFVRFVAVEVIMTAEPGAGRVNDEAHWRNPPGCSRRHRLPQQVHLPEPGDDLIPAQRWWVGSN